LATYTKISPGATAEKTTVQKKCRPQNVGTKTFIELGPHAWQVTSGRKNTEPLRSTVPWIHGCGTYGTYRIPK
jgi:hypothetical protein